VPRSLVSVLPFPFSPLLAIFFFVLKFSDISSMVWRVEQWGLGPQRTGHWGEGPAFLRVAPCATHHGPLPPRTVGTHAGQSSPPHLSERASEFSSLYKSLCRCFRHCLFKRKQLGGFLPLCM
jgi:hypothetical protein